MAYPNRAILSVLMNNKIIPKVISTQMVTKATDKIEQISIDNNSLNEEFINSSHYNFSNYKGLEQAKILAKEIYDPFKHQQGKD